MLRYVPLRVVAIVGGMEGRLACWSERDSGTVKITDEAGLVVEEHVTPFRRTRASFGLLWGSGWRKAPGAQWAQDASAPGTWVVAVIRTEVPGAGGQTS